jgi:hypothetical protein
VRRCVWYRKPQEWGGHDPRWVAAPQKNALIFCLFQHLHRSHMMTGTAHRHKIHINTILKSKCYDIIWCAFETLRTWRQREQGHPKRWLLFTNLHGVTPLKNLHFTLVEPRTSNLTETTRLVLLSTVKNGEAVVGKYLKIGQLAWKVWEKPVLQVKRIENICMTVHYVPRCGFNEPALILNAHQS